MNNHRPGATVANGTEVPVTFGEDGELEPAHDPWPEAFALMDGECEADIEKPVLFIRRYFQFCTRSIGNRQASAKDIAGRLLSTASIFLNDGPTPKEIEELYGLSKQTQSQHRKFFQQEFGNMRSLRLRTPEARANMSEAQKRRHREKEKGPEVTPGLNEKAEPYTNTPEVNFVEGGAS